MKIHFILSLLLLVCVELWSQGYAVTHIPAELKKSASVVKRMDEVRFEITEKNKATYYQKVAFTILDEKGDRWAAFAMGYDKLRSIESFDGSLFDANGKKLRSLKKSEVRDISATDDISLADDNRMKWHSFFYKAYPFTVEYEIEVRFKGTMFSPDWIPQEKPIMSVQQSKLIVRTPEGNPLRYKMFNYKGEPIVTPEKDGKLYTWEVKNINAIEEEYASPSWREITTSVFLATEKFTLEDYDGSNASWKDFGKFVYDLKKDRDVLPDDIKSKVHELTDGLPGTATKVKRLYEYMQKNTRYISIQLGIGGWQPFDAKYVANRKYGDCKALSNFMSALLKEAGIRSVYTVINSGDESDYLLKDLPSSQFNHVILFVPDGKDTIWLECTSQTLAAGYLGPQTSDRYAVAIEENGGTLVRTPAYHLRDNLQTRKIAAKLDEEGHLNAVVTTNYTGLQQHRLHFLINGLSKEKLMEFLKDDLELATYDIVTFNYKEEKKSIPEITETLDLTAAGYATVSGKRFFITPNIFTRTHRKLKPDANRKYDLVLDFEFLDVDSAEISLPAGYIAESIPADTKIESPFGKYYTSVKFDGDKLIYFRHYEHYSGRFAPDKYSELVKFYEDIYKADRARVVLVRK
jgi:hypothetical protein